MSTIHSAFDLWWDNKHHPLSDQKLAEFRSNLSELKLIIIDEVSLLPSDMVYQLSMRLCEIFQSKKYFAGKCVIPVGDILQVTDINQ